MGHFWNWICSIGYIVCALYYITWLSCACSRYVWIPKLFEFAKTQTTIILNFKRATSPKVVLFLFSDIYFIMENFSIQHIFLIF